MAESAQRCAPGLSLPVDGGTSVCHTDAQSPGDKKRSGSAVFRPLEYGDQIIEKPPAESTGLFRVGPVFGSNLSVSMRNLEKLDEGYKGWFGLYAIPIGWLPGSSMAERDPAPTNRPRCSLQGRPSSIMLV